MSENKKNTKPNNKMPKINPYWLYGVLAVLFFGYSIIAPALGTSKELKPGMFDQLALAGDLERVIVVNRSKVRLFVKKESRKKYELKEKSKYSEGTPDFVFNIGTLENFENKIEKFNLELPREDKIYPENIIEEDYLGPILSILFPIGLLVLLWFFLMRRMSGGQGGAGGQIFNIGKSKAKLFDKNSKVNVTFKDVAGLDEAKEEVMEVVDFLKNPKKYTALGGKIPKGVLLVGSPGTGKTLLAKAVAGEAEVPFFSISGSDFVEMFVGVGASRVRDLFKQAREKAPCIIFIDEIDAIGRARGKGAMQGGNDERENTLNQLLVEMDGFTTDKGVILIAATNRPDVLDNALLRPGRFDRQIGIDKPDLKGRTQIFKVHLKGIKTGDDINAEELGEMTPGFAGAEIANVCNEAALIAARNNKKEVNMDDFNYALDKVIGGLEKRNKVISPKEKEIIAYHEAGHAICGWFLEHASPLVKVTIVPRGISTLGYAQYLPKDEYIVRTEQMLDRMCMTLGGRAAEQVVYGKISTGAQNDLDRATQVAYGMVTVYGMDEKVGNVSFYGMQKDSFSKPYSETTAHLIDTEVRNMIEKQYARAQALLTDKRKELELLAEMLLDKEVLLKSDVEKLIGNRPDEQEFIPQVPKKAKVVEANEAPKDEAVSDDNK